MQWLGASLPAVFGDDALTQSIVSCCTRLTTSARFEDKVSALNELENLAKEHPLEVGHKAIGKICDEVLGKFEEDDPILITKGIDILMLLLLPPEEPYDVDSLPHHPTSKTVYYECNLDLLFSPNNQAADRIRIFIKYLGEEYAESIKLQYDIIQILTVVLLYKGTVHKLRSELIGIYGAMNALSELLKSPHEFIRNATVILLAHLSQNDPSIQKLVAFDGAFERVLEITRDEDGVQGGMVVQDCLQLLGNLLLNNESNQKYFVEIGCMEQLKPLLSPSDFQKHEELQIVEKTIDIVLRINKHCGHIPSTQMALGKIMEPLLRIVAYYGSTDQSEEGGRVSMNKLKEKSLILLRIALSQHIENIKAFMAINVEFVWYNTSQLKLERKPIHPLLLVLQLALNGYQLGMHSFYNPTLSALSESLLQTLFTSDRNLQQIIITALPRCKLKSSSSPMARSQWDIAFGTMLLGILTIPETTANKGFGDPLRYWTVTRIACYLLEDNNSMKMHSVSTPLSPFASSSSSSPPPSSSLQSQSQSASSRSPPQRTLSEMTTNALQITIQNRCDQRIQIGILLLLITMSYECRESIYALFSDPQRMASIVNMAVNDGNDDYIRGLATYLVALCLEFARDLSPQKRKETNNRNNGGNGNGSKKQFSSYLFGIVNDSITLDRFKTNLEKLRSTKEYSSMVMELQKCKQRAKNTNHATERQKRMVIEEIFGLEYDIENEEYLALRLSQRFKVHLFDSRLIEKFEAVFAVIDKRIIQLLSSKSNQKMNNGGGPGHQQQMQIHHQHHSIQNMNHHQNDSRYPPQKRHSDPVHSQQESHELSRIKAENDKLKKENDSLKEEMEKMKDDHLDALNVKSTEIEELRKSMQQQTQILLDQKRKLQQQNGINGSKGNNSTPPMGQQTELRKEYIAIRKTYEQLNRDHEDLLVYLGHLQGQYEAAQIQIDSMRRAQMAGGQEQESIESKSNEIEQNDAKMKPKRKNNDGNDPYAPPDLMM